MRFANMFGTLLLVMCTICIVGCNDDKGRDPDFHELTFERSDYKSRLNLRQFIMVRSGNRDYSIDVANDELLDASIDLSSGCGNIQITGKMKGKTTLTITDNKSGDKVDLNIEIVDCYLGFLVAKQTAHPRFKDGDRMFLVNDNTRTLYLYDKNGKCQAEGVYEFTTKENSPYLILKFNHEIEGQKEYRFNILESSSGLFSLHKRYLNVDINTFSATPLESTIPVTYMCIQEVDTNKLVYLVLDTRMMPY